MTRHTFRLTPRATKALRAVEAELRKGEAIPRTEYTDMVINACDFRFAKINGKTIASFERLQIMYTLWDNKECFISDVELTGRVHMQEHRSKTGFVYYVTEKVELLPSTYEEAEAA